MFAILTNPVYQGAYFLPIKPTRRPQQIYTILHPITLSITSMSFPCLRASRIHPEIWTGTLASWLGCLDSVLLSSANMITCQHVSVIIQRAAMT